ncbi:MAG: hypothetical protein ACN2B6_07145 [Rickettsiales bacterium]
MSTAKENFIETAYATFPVGGNECAVDGCDYVEKTDPSLVLYIRFDSKDNSKTAQADAINQRRQIIAMLEGMGYDVTNPTESIDNAGCNITPPEWIETMDALYDDLESVCQQVNRKCSKEGRKK